jgi:hypothetical protein
MATFFIRVELHGAKYPDDYGKLHDAMKTANYSRTIKADDGGIYHLPPAMYFVSSDWTFKAITEEVRGLANATGFSNAVFVAKGDAWQSFGLDPA